MTIQTNNDPAVAEEVAGIENALDALLTIATDKSLARRFDPPRQEDDLQSFSFLQIMKVIGASDAERTTAELIKNPVGEAARLAVRIVGQRLHELGGQGLMTDVLDRISERDPANQARRETIMDRRWDGIGNWCA